MTTRRDAAAHVFVDDVGTGGAVDLPPDAEHHLTRVLRLRDGEVVSISDGRGSWQPTTVVGTGAGVRLETSGEAVFEPRRHEPLTLATAIPKGDRLDWLVQKATEIGVDRIALVHAERSVVRWKRDRVDRQLARLQRVADEAARQSRRVWRVELAAPVPAAEVLPDATVVEPGGREIRPTDALVAVGPEGGWSDHELRSARDRVGLGPNVLRVETAGLVVITLCVAARHGMLGSHSEMH